MNEKQLKSISEKAIDEYFTAGEKLKDLKKRFEKLAQKVSESGKPLVIIIDELDRCRPTFAIELLEKIKHLFNIPRILFIIGIDREQLGYSIKSVYGENMNVDGYLRRFIDMEFILPEANPEVFCSHLFDHLGLNEYFSKRFELSGGHINDARSFREIFTRLCSCFQLSLRDMEHCCRLFVFTYMNTKDNHPICSPLLSILVILKLVNSNLYQTYVSGQCNSEDVVEYILELPRGEDFIKTRVGLIVQAYLLAASPEKTRNIVFSQMHLLEEQASLTQPEFLTDRIKNMPKDKIGYLLRLCSKYIDNIPGSISNSTLGKLSEKIELASLMVGDRE